MLGGDWKEICENDLKSWPTEGAFIYHYVGIKSFGSLTYGSPDRTHYLVSKTVLRNDDRVGSVEARSSVTKSQFSGSRLCLG